MGTSNAGKRLKKFKKENPQYFDLFECLQHLDVVAETYFDGVRKCVAEFEK